MIMLLSLFLACQERESTGVPDPPPVNHKQEVVPQGQISPPKAEPVVFSPIDLDSPLVLSIDATTISPQLSHAFLSQEAQKSLSDPLIGVLSGDVSIRVSAPVRLGTEKPKIVMTLSQDQFLSLAPIQSGRVNTQKLINVFQALNDYRVYEGNNTDLRIFHFWIAIDVGVCRLFPAHQDAFSPIESLDVCVEVDGERLCGQKQEGNQMTIPRICIQSP